MMTNQGFASHDETKHAEAKSPIPYFGANHSNINNQSPPSTNLDHTMPRVLPITESRKYSPNVVMENLSRESNTEAACEQNRAPTIRCSFKERIRHPSKKDVLYGRGGGINNHPGNTYFRSLVNDRREAYKSDINKTRKASISQDIINVIKKSGGRFLEREKINSPISGRSKLTGYWVEVSDVKAMSKTSQALREVASYTRTRVMGQVSTRRKRTSESQQVSIDELPNINFYDPMEKKSSLLKKSRTIDVPIICHSDQSTQTRLETKQEALDLKYDPYLNTQGCDQVSDMESRSRKKECQIVTEGYPCSIQNEIAHSSTSDTQGPIFRIDAPIVYPSDITSKDNISHRPDRVTRLNSLGFANENLIKESFTDIFENEDFLKTPDLETAQKSHCHDTTSQNFYNTSEDYLSTPDLETAQESLHHKIYSQYSYNTSY